MKLKKRRMMLFFAALGLQMGLAGQVAAAPVSLSQGLIPSYMPAGQGQRVASFQPNYRFRPATQRPVYPGYGYPRTVRNSAPARFNNYRHYYYGQPNFNQPRGVYPQYSYYRNGPAAFSGHSMNWKPYAFGNNIAQQRVPMPYQGLSTYYPRAFGPYTQPRFAQRGVSGYRMPQQWRGWNQPRPVANARYNPYGRQYAGMYNPGAYRFRPVTPRNANYQRHAWAPSSRGVYPAHQYYRAPMPTGYQAPRQWRPAMAAAPAPYHFRPDSRFQPRPHNSRVATYPARQIQAQPWQAAAPSYRWRPLIDPASDPKAVHKNGQRVSGILGSGNTLY